MKISLITAKVNEKLAGETLTYSEMRDYLDEVIDDINAALSAKFPVFSDVTTDTYDFFPDRYIRTVVVVGAAYKFYTVDEEGAQSAIQYGYDYKDNMFKMVRDYANSVPTAYQDYGQGFLVAPDATECEVPNPWIGGLL